MQAAPSPTTELWTRVRATFTRAIAVFGPPAAIALLSLTTCAARLEIVHALVRIEHLVRKLLLAEAMALDLPREQRSPRLVEIPLHTRGLPATLNQSAPRQRRAHDLDLTRPETWAAQFSLSIPNDPHIVSESNAPRIRNPWVNAPPPGRAPSPSNRTPRSAAFLIARRFEALRRVLNDPAPHARRLAMECHRALRRSPDVVRRYTLRGPRHDSYDPHDERLPIEVYKLLLRPAADTS